MNKSEQIRLTRWRFKVLQQAAEQGCVARTCGHFGISRNTFYKWQQSLCRTWRCRALQPGRQAAPLAASHPSRGNLPRSCICGRTITSVQVVSQIIWSVFTSSRSLPRRCIGSSCAMAWAGCLRTRSIVRTSSAGSDTRSPSRAIGCRWTSSSSSASRVPGGACISSRPSTTAPASGCSRSTIAATRRRRSGSSTRCGGGCPSGSRSSKPTTAPSSSLAFTGTSRAWISGTPTSARARRTLNGKVERSHRVDDQEFYQLLTGTASATTSACSTPSFASGRTTTITTVRMERSTGKPRTSGSCDSEGRSVTSVLGSYNGRWWPGAESNHRHADFQSQTELCNINCINRLAGAPVATNAPRCRNVQD